MEQGCTRYAVDKLSDHLDLIALQGLPSERRRLTSTAESPPRWWRRVRVRGSREGKARPRRASSLAQTSRSPLMARSPLLPPQLPVALGRVVANSAFWVARGRWAEGDR